ncbi:hypothetical protein QRO08_16660 [Paracidovorax citrulli]|uniref:Phage gp6-like head-tail connector protein n=2 Tax=Paracidovorax citrulli TaxID=80869 RepID=A1TMM0_PARC0|nr:hypothetical protein [Paracidovorax citrulli]ABM32208.1 conserved hypothetical protein [Paracidovorax citrulli AAC00-1]ATG94775.1 hypothetical protein CQB05_12660 [Paracidovorax citrulli]MVT38499.1 hypothetical protein [Paracidovorax citrulli]PVY66402.1 hypothetical protein C8E08_3809 [Paracidovorax citrulli]REG69427.1 hypothetical protein C8E07_2578 [Paracidovorax citrulli]
MALRKLYIGEMPITPEDVAAHRRDDAVMVETALLSNIIIPGVVAQAEARTGAAIRQARYVESWQPSRPSGSPLDVGQAYQVEAVDALSADGVPVPSGATVFLQQEMRESYLHFASGRPSGILQITYLAGLNLAAYPSVRTWLLMQIGTVYAQRETLVMGMSVAALPHSFLDTMLADIEVPPRF